MPPGVGARRAREAGGLVGDRDLRAGDRRARRIEHLAADRADRGRLRPHYARGQEGEKKEQETGRQGPDTHRRHPFFRDFCNFCGRSARHLHLAEPAARAQYDMRSRPPCSRHVHAAAHRPPDPGRLCRMPDAAAGLDKSGRAIRDMFAGVAPRYDLLNHLLSATLDIVWRKKAARGPGHAGRRRGARPVLRHRRPGGRRWRKRGAQVAAADFCVPMLALSRPKFARFAQRRPRPLAADALALPFPGRRFAGATVSFGLRNVADLDRALAEFARVLGRGASWWCSSSPCRRLPPLQAPSTCPTSATCCRGSAG